VLPEAVHQHERIAASRLGHMHPKAGQIDGAMLDSA
jgi:hypothetical protein